MAEAKVALLSCLVDLIGGWDKTTDVISLNYFSKAGNVQSMSGIEVMLRGANSNGVGAGSACGLEEKNNDM